jgi:tetratricopeptide (TPR) repeat protein
MDRLGTSMIALVAWLQLGACKGHRDHPAPSPEPPAAAATPSPRGSATPHVDEGPPPPTIDEAIARAKAAGEPLVAEFYTQWCPPCQEFARTTLVDKRVQAALQDVVFVRYDAEAGPGIAAASRYHVASFPTFLAIDASGAVRSRSEGAATGEQAVQRFLGFLDQAARTTIDEKALRARLAAHPHDAGVQLAAARWYAARGRTSDALAQYDAVATSHEASAAQRATAKLAAKKLRRVARWKQELVAEELDRARSSPASIDEHALALATVDSGAAPADIRAAIANVLAAQTDPIRLNSLLYVALAAGATDEALAAAKQAFADTKDPDLLDTLAECYRAHGDRANALAIEDRALALSGPKPSPELIANRARFASGEGESGEITAVRDRVAQTWRRLAHVDDPPSPSDATAPQGDAAKAAMTMYMATMQLGQTVAHACAEEAGSSDGAFARVTLDASGKVTSSSLYLPAGASADLRACITAQLATATLPTAPGLHLPPIAISFTPDGPSP